jgi:hypothetical protein
LFDCLPWFSFQILPVANKRRMAPAKSLLVRPAFFAASSRAKTVGAKVEHGV